MSIPSLSLLIFALWTVGTLLATVGAYRWRQILAGSVPIREFRHGESAGQSDWYRRAMRAHGNCVENLPVFAVIVLLGNDLDIVTRIYDSLAVIYIVARICQTIVHVAFSETNRTVSVRFAFFFTQLLAAMSMGAVIATTASGH